MISAGIRQIERACSRSPKMVSLAAKVRNHCNIILGLSLADGTAAETNGELWILKTLGPRAKVFMDVGANKGEWTTDLMQYAPSAAMGFCFEPNPQLQELLARKVSVFPNIHVINAGVSSEVGELTLSIVEEDEHSSFCDLSATKGQNVTMAVAEVCTLDDFAAEHGLAKIDLVKIDTEGWDFAVMRGAQRLLAEGSIEYMQFEYGHNWITSGTTLSHATRWLSDREYEVMAITGQGLRKCDPQLYGEFYRYSNFLAARKASLEQLL